MANVEMRYSNYFEIDLEDYGHSESTTFEELSEEEKNEIIDHLREEAIVRVDVKTINE